jgi:hypothetical protein
MTLPREGEGRAGGQSDALPEPEGDDGEEPVEPRSLQSHTRDPEVLPEGWGETFWGLTLEHWREACLAADAIEASGEATEPGGERRAMTLALFAVHEHEGTADAWPRIHATIALASEVERAPKPRMGGPKPDGHEELARALQGLRRYSDGALPGPLVSNGRTRSRRVSRMEQALRIAEKLGALKGSRLAQLAEAGRGLGRGGDDRKPNGCMGSGGAAGQEVGGA